MKKFVARLFFILTLITTLLTVKTGYEFLHWSTSVRPEPGLIGQNPFSPHPELDFSRPTPGMIQQEPETFKPGKLPEISGHTLPANWATPSGALADSQTRTTESVYILSEKTVYTDVNNLVNLMGWTITSDGCVYSDKQCLKKVLKIDLNSLPSPYVEINGQRLKLSHPVIKKGGLILLPLTDLKKLWIVDFVIDPSTGKISIRS